MLKVTNDILLSLDSGSHVILVLLDLSSAYDTIDEEIASYLKDRTVSVNLGDFSGSFSTWCSSGLDLGTAAVLSVYASSELYFPEV